MRHRRWSGPRLDGDWRDHPVFGGEMVWLVVIGTIILNLVEKW
jgi:hypothetical protein